MAEILRDEYGTPHKKEYNCLGCGKVVTEGIYRVQAFGKWISDGYCKSCQKKLDREVKKVEKEHSKNKKYEECYKCSGTGKINSHKCVRCNGKGKVIQTDYYDAYSEAKRRLGW